MTALSADRTHQSRGHIEIRDFPVKDGAVIYKGALLVFDATDGFVKPAADATGNKFAGIALEPVDNTGGADGAKRVRAAISGCWLLTHTGLDATDQGKIAFVADDNTLDDGGADNFTAVGVCVEYVSSSTMWVEIGLFAGVGTLA